MADDSNHELQLDEPWTVVLSSDSLRFSSFASALAYANGLLLIKQAGFVKHIEPTERTLTIVRNESRCYAAEEVA